MSQINEILLSTWRRGRSDMLRLLDKLNTEDLSKRFTPEMAGIGFLLGHNAEVELFFCSMFFDRAVELNPKTVGGAKDTGQYLSLEEIKAIIIRAETEVVAAIMALEPSRWTESVESFLGTHTRAEALGRLINHTGYHTGQAWLIYKRA